MHILNLGVWALLQSPPHPLTISEPITTISYNSWDNKNSLSGKCKIPKILSVRVKEPHNAGVFFRTLRAVPIITFGLSGGVNIEKYTQKRFPGH